MANQTVSSSINFDTASMAGLANGDDITVDTNATLTINSDVRWSQNAAVIGNMTISATTGGTITVDGTEVWWMPYDGGTGNVPALGTVNVDDVTGSVAGTGEFLGVFTAHGVAPSTAGGAMPATGFIKFRRVTNAFVDNEVMTFTGGATATVNSTTGGKRGWLSLVGEEATTITVGRLGTLNFEGDWFVLDTVCSGARNQTIQLPVADQYGGVWIETGDATNVWEFYPNVGAQMNATAFPATTTDDTGKVVFISATGLLRIGSNATPTNCAFLPTANARIRIPNIIISASTSANWAANLVSTTLASRWDITCTAAGAINLNYFTGAGFGMNTSASVFGQMYSLTLTHGVILEQFAVQECATEMIFTDFHVGLPATNLLTVGSPITVITSFAGATFTDCIFTRATMAASVVNGVFTDCDGFDFVRCRFVSATAKSGNTPVALGLTRVANSTMTDCVIGDGRALITTCQNLTITGTLYYDRIGTTTTTANPVSALDLTTGCTDITISGFSIFDSLTNRHPYTAIVNISSNCQRIKVRNIGTAASPFDCGSSNATGVLVQANGLNSNIKVQRVYATNTRTSAFGTMVNSDTIITAECVWCDAADTQALTANNMIAKGCRWTNTTTGQTAVYGTHFSDVWTSTTAGRLVIQGNEKTTAEPSASSYSVVSGNPKFTSTGNLILATSGDSILYEWSYYVKGIASFLPATATQPTFTGTNPNNHGIYYKIDNNDGNGFNASYRNLAYKRAGGGGSGGTTTVTMTSTTGVNVDDYVFGTGIGTNSQVVSVDNATTITVSVNNSGAVSGVLVFNQLPNETVDPVTGVKLRVKIDANTTSATNAMTYLRIDTVTTSSDQNDALYPLDTVDATFSFSGLAVGTEVVLFDNTGVEIDREVIAGTTYEYPYEWNSTDGDLTGWYALIWKDDKFPIVFNLPDLNGVDTDVPIAQADDLVYNATYTPNTTINFSSQLIIMDTGAVEYSVPEVYSYWKDEIRLTNNAQYAFAYSIVGGNTISGANSIPKYTFQANGWKVRPDEADHTLDVTDGILVGESGADPFVDTLGAYTVRINYQQPVQAIAVSTGGGGGATASDVWSYATRTLSTGGVTAIQSGLATEANATTNTGSIVTILNALNDIAPSEVLTQVTNALNSYDPPTKAELDAAQSSIEAEIAAQSAPTPTEIWEHTINGKQAQVRLQNSEDSAELASIK